MFRLADRSRLVLRVSNFVAVVVGQPGKRALIQNHLRMDAIAFGLRNDGDIRRASWVGGWEKARVVEIEEWNLPQLIQRKCNPERSFLSRAAVRFSQRTSQLFLEIPFATTQVERMVAFVKPKKQFDVSLLTGPSVLKRKVIKPDVERLVLAPTDD